MHEQCGRTTRQGHDRHIEELVAAACRLVGSGNDVRSIRVVTHGRPTYDELHRYQEWAHGRHLRLNVDGEGVVTVRPEAAAGE